MRPRIHTLIQKGLVKRGKLISIVLPIYNEEDSLPKLIEEFFSYLPSFLPEYLFEITFIDDCSKDSSFEIVTTFAKASPKNIKLSIVQLSKNSGSHIAISAGINISRGDFVVIMASDGQDPVSIIKTLIDRWQSGNELILASREDNLGQGFFSKRISKTAWKLMNWSTNINMPEKGCDLLGMDRLVVDAFNRLDERNTTFIFQILSLGFKQTEVQYVKRARFGGKSKWTIFKKIAILLDAISGFSSRPLKLITNFGLLIFLILLFRWFYVVFDIYILGNEPTELTIILNSLFSALAIVVLLIGMVGDYIWRILDESRKRPIYEFRRIEGEVFDDSLIS